VPSAFDRSNDDPDMDVEKFDVPGSQEQEDLFDLFHALDTTPGEIVDPSPIQLAGALFRRRKSK
jgi:hypothetical protein